MRRRIESRGYGPFKGLVVKSPLYENHKIFYTHTNPNSSAADYRFHSRLTHSTGHRYLSGCYQIHRRPRSRGSRGRGQPPPIHYYQTTRTPQHHSRSSRTPPPLTRRRGNRQQSNTVVFSAFVFSPFMFVWGSLGPSSTSANPKKCGCRKKYFSFSCIVPDSSINSQTHFNPLQRLF